MWISHETACFVLGYHPYRGSGGANGAAGDVGWQRQTAWFARRLISGGGDLFGGATFWASPDRYLQTVLLTTEDIIVFRIS